MYAKVSANYTLGSLYPNWYRRTSSLCIATRRADTFPIKHGRAIHMHEALLSFFFGTVFDNVSIDHIHQNPDALPTY